MQVPAWLRRIPAYLWLAVAVGLVIALFEGVEPFRSIERSMYAIPAFGALCLLAAWLLRRRERRRATNATPPALAHPNRWHGSGGGALTRKDDGSTFWKRR